MAHFIGIPDDSPNLMAHNIVTILQEEAQELGATFDIKKDRNDISDRRTITLTLNDRTFVMSIQWVRDDRLRMTNNLTIGHGRIEPDWELRLETHYRSLPLRPPFFWHLVPAPTANPSAPPEQTLDQPLLQKLIHQQLLSPR